MFFSDGFVTSIRVLTSSTFSAGNPTKLYDTRYFPGDAERTYDVTRDGQKFLMIKDAARPEPAQTPAGAHAPINIVVVLNWTEELKARLPQR